MDAFGNQATKVVAVNRWFNNPDNGPFNVEANNEPDNRKLGKTFI